MKTVTILWSYEVCIDYSCKVVALKMRVESTKTDVYACVKMH
jgi:hypothetical protein